ncbi:Root primordium defective [Thalictrum thalictroides]|uniref:Root primordium defective n=1 Tax=Thalictrum thalictroides TaxID=46969 RepID=A0A7J6UTF4_THATH|nr:Root primordium defective [Thalictrum thalictroides]
MAIQMLIRNNPITIKLPFVFSIRIRFKTTSAQYVAARARDPTFEKLMKNYKNLLKVFSIQDLILANPRNPTLAVDVISTVAQKLHLNRGAIAFLRKYPHIFSLFNNREKFQPFCKLTEKALQISRQEAAALDASKPIVVDRLVRLLSISESKSLPLRAIFKVWRELGLPDDFENSVIAQNPNLFLLCDAHEPKTHILKLVAGNVSPSLSTSVENWRREECGKEDSKYDTLQIRFAFKHTFPPGMRLSKDFRAKVKEWQSFPYIGPYSEMREKKKTRAGVKALEKRAVAIVHEFLSLTVEKMVEVEKISHFRKWFGIDLNIRDLFLDHPGIFYLSTKGKRHMVFLREAYERGCLIDPNPVYDARRRLLDLVMLGRRGLFLDESGTTTAGGEDSDSEEDDGD